MLNLKQLAQGTLKAGRKTTTFLGTIKIIALADAKTKKATFIGNVRSQSDRGTSVYKTVIVFENVALTPVSKRQKIPLKHFSIKDRQGNTYLSPMLTNTHKVKIRCNCMDFRFAWAEWVKRAGSLFGKDFPPYVRKTTTRPPVNPKQLPGMCKHLFMTARVLIEKGYLAYLE